MISIGEFNVLRVNRQTLQGFYLACPDKEEVLLPNKYVPKTVQIDEMIDVFVYTDSEDRIVATTLDPYVIVGEFAYMDVLESNSIGAFLDWGLEKDLFVPMKEQRSKMVKGESYVVYAYLDETTQRVVATTKFNKYLKTDEYSFAEGDEVELLVADKTDLGYSAIINDEAKGLIFNSEVHQPLAIGKRLKGWVKSIREDGKIDIALQKVGVEHLEDSAKKVVQVLTQNAGALAVGDHSSPEEINRLFGLSKKAFKRAVGILYKQRLVEITDTTIKLTSTN
jgi:predicted RNA-binding protein (virulence factor B family)